MSRNHRAIRAIRSAAGFTLVELLVALALLALTVALLPGTLRLGARAWEARGELEQAGEVGLAFHAIEQKLLGALPIYESGGEAGGVGLAFRGDAQTLSFVAASENGPAGAGLYRWQLGPATGQTTGLLMGIGLHLAGAPATVGETRTLLRDGSAVRFRYRGAQPTGSEPAEWHEAWTRSDALPELVEMRIEGIAGSTRGQRRLLVAPRVGIRQ